MDANRNVGRFAPGNPGRPKGAQNRTTATAKEAFTVAAEELGGADRLVEWAKEDPANERVFWTLYARLIPVDVAAKVETDNHVHITREVISKPVGQ